MSISLDNINFCSQPPPPKPIATPRWKPYRLPSSLDAPKPGAAAASAPAQYGAAASGPVKA
ncbi:hypothetical protein ACJ73_05499 [Blastomyces percursus]|uniref:Uncharacterized protein n=1 Tax=Blastomyces percursus TaxID=1658174 RepID=A0A1J9QSE0_9EURO|nr:hypothetical protein ACJ73_05499 [Blastomyces percursus]